MKLSNYPGRKVLKWIEGDGIRGERTNSMQIRSADPEEVRQCTLVVAIDNNVGQWNRCGTYGGQIDRECDKYAIGDTFEGQPDKRRRGTKE